MRSDTKAINNVFFGSSAESKLSSLRSEISNMRTQLRNLYKEYTAMLESPQTTVTDSMIESLISRYPFLKIKDSSNTGSALLIQMEKCPVYFHKSNHQDTFVNDGIIYVTMPQYSFQLKLLSSRSYEVSNITRFLDYNPDITTDVRCYQDFGHPHARERYRECGRNFQNLCYGTNRYGDVITSGITPGKFTDFVRRVCIWFTHANVDDMYDAPLGPVRELREREIYDAMDIDDLFRRFQEHIITSGMRFHDAGREYFLDFPLLSQDNVDSLYGSSEGQLILFQQIYALWLYKHWNTLSRSGLSVTNRESMKAAVMRDIATIAVTNVSICRDSSINGITRHQNYVLGAPKELKNLIVRYSSNSAVKSVVEQILL